MFSFFKHFDKGFDNGPLLPVGGSVCSHSASPVMALLASSDLHYSQSACSN